MKHPRLLWSLFMGVLSLGFVLSFLPQSAAAQQKPLPNFSCGPYMETYVVSSPDFFWGEGIRCVKWNLEARTGARVPAFAWYGEGRWDGIVYRHVGHAFASPDASRPNTYHAFATDMYGNGETVQGDYFGGFVITVLDRDTIQVSQGWNETWKRVPSVGYIPLPPPTTCGQYFDQYSVQSLDSYSARYSRKPVKTRQGQGVRCVLKSGATNTTWLGFGTWNGAYYMHLATGAARGFGASDFCSSPQDICNEAPYGTLRKRISQTWKKTVVDGWNEIWLK
jgi:hypothetical protein